ncbi:MULTISPECIES: helix-turn-helix transcriptional regulator [unclassified Microcoleus]|uniref:helix-turn-helix transcriptional regulator n=1 Tax=unclassified Microcoleus TaxID=2642155 RepID=UPI002FD5B319
MTQQQLADRIETKQSLIARLEDAEYDGHSLAMLQKIARALNQRLEVQQGRSPLMKITLRSYTKANI